MQKQNVQMVMAAVGIYKGGIDGDFGPKSAAARVQVETRFAAKYIFDPTTTTPTRRLVACGQACLDQLGHAPGEIDGWEGSNTTEAMNAFLFTNVNGTAEVIERAPLPSGQFSNTIPHQNDVASVYGNPGPQIEARLKMIELPFTLRIDYNLRQKTRRIRVHHLAAAQLKKALIEVHEHYGMARMNALGIDRYAGAYNHRRMRGGSKWSMHAYGCAIDFYAKPNGLRMKCPQALFCKTDYQPFLNIMEANEWLPALRLWGADAMHFQRARL